MGDSNIEWTDKTWNPTTGCTRVSPGCTNCYAFELHDKRHASYVKGHGRYPDGSKVPEIYAKPFDTVQLLPHRLEDPVKWRAPVRIFVDSMSDLFHADVPDDYLVKVWDVMRRCPQHIFQILTKRPRRMRALLEARQLPMLPNVWLGVSVENQEAADLRIPELVRTPAAIRFLSCEPLLGPVDLLATPAGDVLSQDCVCHGAGEGIQDEASTAFCDSCCGLGPIHWVIVGGESGHKARLVTREWIHTIVLDCQDAGAAVFVKQLGSVWARQVKSRHLDGGLDWHGNEITRWPKELQVREYPNNDRAKALLAFTPANLLPREAA